MMRKLETRMTSYMFDDIMEAVRWAEAQPQYVNRGFKITRVTSDMHGEGTVSYLVEGI